MFENVFDEIKSIYESNEDFLSNDIISLNTLLIFLEEFKEVKENVIHYKSFDKCKRRKEKLSYLLQVSRIVVKMEDTFKGNKVLNNNRAVLFCLYNYYLNGDNYCKTINSVNSSFLVDINEADITIYNGNSANDSTFVLTAYIGSNDKFRCFYRRSNEVGVISYDNLELLKKVYVKIDDCPLWCEIFLKNIRSKEIEKMGLSSKEDVSGGRILKFVKKKN